MSNTFFFMVSIVLLQGQGGATFQALDRLAFPWWWKLEAAGAVQLLLLCSFYFFYHSTILSDSPILHNIKKKQEGIYQGCQTHIRTDLLGMLGTPHGGRRCHGDFSAWYHNVVW